MDECSYAVHLETRMVRWEWALESPWPILINVSQYARDFKVDSCSKRVSGGRPWPWNHLWDLNGRHVYYSEAGASLLWPPTILRNNFRCHSLRQFAFANWYFRSRIGEASHNALGGSFFNSLSECGMSQPLIPLVKTPLTLFVKVKNFWGNQRHSLSKHKDKPSKHV